MIATALLTAALIFITFIIGLELYTGFAIIGWAGDNMVVERAKSPGPYWFAITMHLLIGVSLPIFCYFYLNGALGAG